MEPPEFDADSGSEEVEIRFVDGQRILMMKAHLLIMSPQGWTFIHKSISAAKPRVMTA